MTELEIDCERLWEWVVLPIELPLVRSDSVRGIIRRWHDIVVAFRKYAREMGHEKVLLPIIDKENCRVSYDEAVIDHVVPWVDEYELRSGSGYVIGRFLIIRIKDIAFPIARDEHNQHTYADYLIDVAKAVMLVKANPWITEALGKAVGDVLSDIGDTHEIAMRTYNALRLIGAEVED